MITTAKPVIQHSMINVTKSYLPPFEDYVKYLEKIWDNNWLTNNGPLVRELEEKITEYLGVKHFFFVTNGTIALQVAIKALELKGKILTTPYSYVATTTSILWENCEPVFVDIDKASFCLNADLIEEMIDEDTVGILATHVYGNPCHVEKIEAIAKKHNLKVIYDGAHAFGVEVDNNSVFNYGDISTLSFHATKLFHTIEGGGIVTADDDLAKQIDYYRAFGHKGDEHFTMGINAKNSEFHAAMGLCNLPRVPGFIERRKYLTGFYNSILADADLLQPSVIENVTYNYSYYPVVFKSEAQLEKVRTALAADDIIPRRYFYPSLNTLPYLKEYHPCPVSEAYANQVLCLPFYIDLDEEDIKRIGKVILENL